MCGPSRSATSPKSRTRSPVMSMRRVWVMSSLTLTVQTKGRPTHCQSHVLTVARLDQEETGAFSSTVPNRAAQGPNQAAGCEPGG